MSAVLKTQQMDWSKYTIDGWLEQFGAWCETVRMKGGDLPDGLHINQIYWLMREAGKEVQKSKSYIRCEISDYEADQIQALLRSLLNSDKTDFTTKFALICLIKNKVENKGLLKVAQETNQSKAQVAIMVSCARFYLLGHDKRLRQNGGSNENIHCKNYMKALVGEKVNETLKYYPDYFGKISIITNVINNKLQLTLKAFEGIDVITANDLMIKIVERLKASQLVEKHNLDLLTV